MVGYFAPSGHYAASPYYFYTPPPTGGNVLNSPPLHAASASAEPLGGVFTSANGLYSYGAASTLPTSSINGTNYWVDVSFEPNPITAPGQVTGVTATAAGGSATVNWTAPASGGPVTTYTITPYVGLEAQTPTTVTGAPPATGTIVGGLKNGTSYTFTVTASNPAGSGAPSEHSNAVTPTTATAPSAPTGVSAISATGRALVSWSAPSNSGGSPITKYTITPFVGAEAKPATTITGSPPATATTITGLTNATSYTFTVTASNAIGESPQSTASNAVTPQDTIFNFAAPTTLDSGDASSVELGVKFSSEVAGNITGIRFYKATTNTGTHIGSLWSTNGTQLASATFTGESASGWQQVNFSKPVAIEANTTYVAAYFAPSGHYSDTLSGFANGISSPPLTALANISSPDGVYAYTSVSAFPNNTFNATNYWVDVNFEPTPILAPGQVTSVSATAGTGSANLTWSAPATGGPTTKYTITPYIGSTAQPTTTVTGTPPVTGTTVTELKSGSGYTFTVTASNSAGSGAASEPSNVVTPTAPTAPSAPTAVTASAANASATVSWTVPSNSGGSPITKYTITPFVGAEAKPATTITGSPPATATTITGLTNTTTYTFTVTASNAIGESPQSTASNPVTPTAPVVADTIFASATPGTLDSGDTASVELGVKFSSEVAGNVTGIRFYKATTNTGTHIGSLWSTNGTQLASATFTGESASGWQQVNFSKPVAIEANTTYVAAYFAPSGHYSDTPSGFASGVSSPPLTALANALSPDGVYTYSATSAFPSNSFNATNYWVDVNFEPTPTAPPGQVTGVSATAATGSANLTWSAPASGGPTTKYTITPYIGSTAQTTRTVTGSPPATGATVSALTGGTSYTFTVTASNSAGSGAASEPSNVVTPTAPTAPSAPTAVTAVAGGHSATVSWTAPANSGGSPITKYTITPFVGAEAKPATTITGSPPATATTITGLTNTTSYTFTVTASNAIGESPQSTASNPVTPQEVDTIFGVKTPATVDSGDTNSVELGVKFSSEVAGNITGIRFYKATTNTGTHIGSLWSTNGTQLASATFTGESASGWQQVNFSAPVAITAKTTYVAAYLAPKGHYSDTPAGFTSATSTPPLTALANSSSADGVYIYTSASAFPTSTFNATNYWVDVVFQPGS